MSDGFEFVCKSCEGTGRHPSHARRGRHARKKCYECGGKGKLDWIENIVGKKPIFHNPNAAFGYKAGMILTTGSKNFAIGYKAGCFS